MLCIKKAPQEKCREEELERMNGESPISISIEDEGEDDESSDEENTENTELKAIQRVLLLGDANIGKYELFGSLSELCPKNELAPGRGWINVPIRSECCLSFSHIEGLEEDPRLRAWKYRNVDTYLLFFSLCKLESLYSVAYKWGPEIRNFMEHLEKMGRRVHLGLIGLKPDWPNASLMPSYMIDSLKSLLSPDFYFEMNKTFDVAATSELIILLEKRIFEEASPIPGNNDGSTLLNRGSNETLNDSDTEELPACPFLELQDDEFISEFSTPKEKGKESNGIFNGGIVSRPRQAQLIQRIDELQTVKLRSVEQETHAKTDILEQIQGILQHEELKHRHGDLRTSKFFISNPNKHLSEDSLFYKKKILPQVIPERSWTLSLWNKKKFKEYMSKEVNYMEKDDVIQTLQDGFQHLSEASQCHSPSIPKRYMADFESKLLACLEVLSSEEPCLSNIKLSDFYLLCHFNLIKCLEYLIYRYPKGFGYLMMSYSRRRNKGPHPLNLIDDEGFVIKVMKIYHPRLYSAHRDRNGYNFLHYFGDKNFKYALALYFQFNLPDSHIPFAHEKDASSPIAVAAQSGNESIAIDMFDHLNTRLGSNEDFLAYFKHIEFRSQSILFVCAQHKLHGLLAQMIKCFEDRGLEKELSQFLVEQNSSDDGRTLLHNLGSERILCKLILIFLRDNPRNILLSCKKNNHLGHYMAQRNYAKVLQTIHEFCTSRGFNDLFFFEFLFSPNKYGDDCFKLAAWKGSNEFLVSGLSFCQGISHTYLSLLLHGENKNQENILELLLIQQGSLIVPRQIIMLMEKEFHYSDEVQILSCYREHISPSEELVSLIQDTQKLLPLSTSKKGFIVLKGTMFFIFSISLYLLDVGFDISLAIRYAYGTDDACSKDFYSFNETTEGAENNFSRALRYTDALCFSTRFYVTLFFILSPWLFYIFEFMNETFVHLRPMYIVYVPYKKVTIPSYRSMKQASQLLQARIDQLEDNRLVWDQRLTCKSIGNNLLFIFCFLIEFFFTILLWPILSMINTFYADIQYNIKHGHGKIKAREYKVKASKVSSRARLIEALLESSFQPILQLYLVLPILINTITSNEESTDVYLEFVQFGSAITSVASISWAITAYQSDAKGGAMDLTVNFLGRFVLLLTNLFTITGRLLLFIVFAYGFGPGRLIGLILFILVHIILATILVHIWKNPMDGIPSKITYFINCVINGFGNCYLHMWILPPRNTTSLVKLSKSSLTRHLTFEVLFFLELVSMACFAHYMLDPRVSEAIQLEYLILLIGALYCLGVLLRIVYYEFVHLWSGLNSFRQEIQKTFSKVKKK